MEIEEVKKLASKVHGWVSDGECELLYSLAKNCTGKGVIVEIGSWKGKSTTYLAWGSKSGKKLKVYAVDPGTSPEHKLHNETSTSEKLIRNIQAVGVDDIVIPVIKTSEEAIKEINEPVELIFIDGDHKYPSVKQDFELWFPRVVNGGVMAFHDTVVYPGPKKVVSDQIYRSKFFRSVRFVDTITYAEKVEQNTLIDRLKNMYILCLKSVYEPLLRFSLPRPVVVVGKRFLRSIQ